MPDIAVPPDYLTSWVSGTKDLHPTIPLATEESPSPALSEFMTHKIGCCHKMIVLGCIVLSYFVTQQWLTGTLLVPLLSLVVLLLLFSVSGLK